MESHISVDTHVSDVGHIFDQKCRC